VAILHDSHPSSVFDYTDDIIEGRAEGILFNTTDTIRICSRAWEDYRILEWETLRESFCEHPSGYSSFCRLVIALGVSGNSPKWISE
jgi:hypothetical protein